MACLRRPVGVWIPDSDYALGMSDLGQSLDDFRARTLDQVLTWTAILALVPSIAGVALAIKVGLWAIVAVDVGSYVAIVVLTVGRRIPYPIRAGSFLAILGGLGLGLLVAVGPFGVGLVWLVAAPALAGVFFDGRGLRLTLGLGMAGLAAVLAMSSAGWLWWAELEVPGSWWMMAGLSVWCVALLVGGSNTATMARLHRSLEQVRAANQELLEEAEVRRRAEQAREALQDQLLFSQKMEVVGQLSGGLAHDLNNLLTVINMEGEFARDAMSGHGEATEALDDLLDAAGSASAICSRLLGFARQRVGHREPLALDDQLRGMEPLLRTLVGERVVLHLQLASQGWIAADTAEIEQIVTSLVANAADAMPDGGRVVAAHGTVGGGVGTGGAARGRGHGSRHVGGHHGAGLRAVLQHQDRSWKWTWPDHGVPGHPTARR